VLVWSKTSSRPGHIGVGSYGTARMIAPSQLQSCWQVLEQKTGSADCRKSRSPGDIISPTPLHRATTPIDLAIMRITRAVCVPSNTGEVYEPSAARQDWIPPIPYAPNCSTLLRPQPTPIEKG